jgi:hypothetical protein
MYPIFSVSGAKLNVTMVRVYHNTRLLSRFLWPLNYVLVAFYFVGLIMVYVLTLLAPLCVCALIVALPCDGSRNNG